MFSRLYAVVLLSLLTFCTHAAMIKDGYAFSILGEPKYLYNFNHFDYVNPAAPKGGSIILAAVGTFDNVNYLASHGHTAIGSGLLYDSLFTPSADELGSYYPLIADAARYDNHFKWVEVEMNPQARFQDGTPVTAQDVAFTFKIFMEKGTPRFRLAHKGVIVKAISRLTVRLEFRQSNREKLLELLSLPIFSEKFWKQHKSDHSQPTPLLGSGPYRISHYQFGQYIAYSRAPDYWAMNLPVNRGRYNLDTIRYNYYPSNTAALAAFNAGSIDFIRESSPENWATQYQGHNVDNHYIIKRDEVNQTAQDTHWLAFNIQRPIFKDRRVREALTLLFDFDRINNTLFYNAYQRSTSYFQNTIYAATQYPEARELTWLAPLKGQIPEEVFHKVYHPPHSKGRHNQANLLKATDLLKQAGWEIKDQQLINKATGKPFTFELLLPNQVDAQYALLFQHDLQRLGIKMTIKQTENAQFVRHTRQHDYDMIPVVYKAQPYPGKDLLMLWNSKYMHEAGNKTGVTDPAIDKLTEEIAAHQSDPVALLPLAHALDRVLTWKMLMIPLWYNKYDNYAYWNKFSMPASRTSYLPVLDTWWFDVNKAARLPTESH